jgi:hypothetical protein
VSYRPSWEGSDGFAAVVMLAVFLATLCLQRLLGFTA